MKIQNSSNAASKPVDLSKIFLKLQEQNHTVYMEKIENDVFFYRPLGRLEFRQLMSDESISDFQKEDLICQACVLWPADYDWDNCDAGLPRALTEVIMKNSYLDSLESRKLITATMRQEMFELDNQITCIINEAFPQFDIEEIENWGIERTAKYLSRAEWKLVNLRGMNMAFDPMEMVQQDNEEEYEQPPVQQQQYRQQPQPVQQPAPKYEPAMAAQSQANIAEGKFESVEDRIKRFDGKPKERMTPEKLAELRAKYPEIDWANAEQVQDLEKLQREAIDTMAPALRPGF